MKIVFITAIMATFFVTLAMQAIPDTTPSTGNVHATSQLAN